VSDLEPGEVLLAVLARSTALLLLGEPVRLGLLARALGRKLLGALLLPLDPRPVVLALGRVLLELDPRRRLVGVAEPAPDELALPVLLVASAVETVLERLGVLVLLLGLALLGVVVLGERVAVEASVGAGRGGRVGDGLEAERDADLVGLLEGDGLLPLAGFSHGGEEVVVGWRRRR